jgi:DNA-binding beta-propeller fold protein YncE
MASAARGYVGALILVLSVTGLAWADRIVVVAGGGDEPEGIPAARARLQAPFGVDFDRSGKRWYIVELIGGRVLQVDEKGKLVRVAGTGKKGSAGDGGPALQAEFNGMHSLAVAPGGDVYLADTWNNRVRRLEPKTGTVTNVAGTGEKGYGGDGGPAAKAKFGGIYCVALDPKGERLYLADLDNRRIRAIDLTTGIVSTVAGNGEKGVPEDGAVAVKAPLVDPRAVAVDRQGNVYILERGGHALRVVDPSGKIRTVVGTGKPGSAGDGGDARKAMLNGPKHLCIDNEGRVLIADTENHLIRMYLPREGTIVRLAGMGKRGAAGIGGDPLQAELNQPHGVCVHPNGSLFIADSSNNRVLQIER